MVRIEKNYSLKEHNTFGIDVRAKMFIEYSSKDELIDYIEKEGLQPPFLHIGSGSNLLFLRDYEGVILHSLIKDIEILEESEDALTLRVGAGYDWDEFVAYTVSKEWYGLENLSLIPGEVGSSAVQNIGAYGAEAKDFILQIDTVDTEGNPRTFFNDECNYSYRYSIFKEPQNKKYIVTHVYFKLSKKRCFNIEYGSLKNLLSGLPSLTLQAVRDAIIQVREEKLPDPKQIGNAGSFFMNPVVTMSKFLQIQDEYPRMPHYVINEEQVKIPAGWLIDVCGWKGRFLGNAGVHDKQALVLINRGGATGEDVKRLALAIQKDVKDKFDIDIFPEVNFIG